MTPSLQSLARTIAKARHGTDAMWKDYVPYLWAAKQEIVPADVLGGNMENAADEAAERLRAIIAQPDGTQ